MKIGKKKASWLGLTGKGRRPLESYGREADAKGRQTDAKVNRQCQAREAMDEVVRFDKARI